ncbi:uncharacterized protein LOC130824888 [Amaranthus tricolor]|uniref:uncharacterized protein LOC130824888 n=1 Tax=Amaranthus tricolor TaxID=29722 RepID=UPI002587EBA5|nr:uncharacterized protein LOC130824888 [Amaranthus tricolor]
MPRSTIVVGVHCSKTFHPYFSAWIDLEAKPFCKNTVIHDTDDSRLNRNQRLTQVQTPQQRNTMTIIIYSQDMQSTFQSLILSSSVLISHLQSSNTFNNFSHSSHELKEIVAMFLHVLAHDLKNRTIQATFAHFGETISRQFHVFLKALLKLGKYYIKQCNNQSNYIKDTKWNRFEVQAHYRDRKGDISTNVLAACSALDPRVLRDALQRPNGLKIPRNKYFLVDLRFANAEGYLAPYRGTRYHLNLWRGTIPTNYKELFNLQHSSARNTIERAFGLLKKRWSILRDPNEDLLNIETIDKEDVEDDYIFSTQSSNEWKVFRDNLAQKIFEEYQ